MIDSLNMLTDSKRELLTMLHRHHYSNCREFQLTIDALNLYDQFEENPEEIFLHSSLFKSNILRSNTAINSDSSILVSSGTSGQRSRIFADRETRVSQQRALLKIVGERLSLSPRHRIPYYVIDTKDILVDKSQGIQARQAAIMGFNMFGKSPNYLLNSDFSIDLKVLEKLISDDQPKLLFGFTWVVYKYFLMELIKQGINFTIPNSYLVHGGGWKKTLKEGVSNDKFKSLVTQLLSITHCINYYGMIEQTGSIFMECSHGYLHVNQFSDIIFRTNTLELSSINNPGIVQSISLLPKSYPGHSLLTEDFGVLRGYDGCKCGANGKYFEILGRLNKTIVRGCSDVY